MLLLQWLLKHTRPGFRAVIQVFGDGTEEAGQRPDGEDSLRGDGYRKLNETVSRGQERERRGRRQDGPLEMREWVESKAQDVALALS